MAERDGNRPVPPGRFPNGVRTNPVPFGRRRESAPGQARRRRVSGKAALEPYDRPEVPLMAGRYDAPRPEGFRSLGADERSPRRGAIRHRFVTSQPPQGRRKKPHRDRKRTGDRRDRGAYGARHTGIFRIGAGRSRTERKRPRSQRRCASPRRFRETAHAGPIRPVARAARRQSSPRARRSSNHLRTFWLCCCSVSAKI